MTSSTSNDLRWRLGNLTAMLLLAAGIAWTAHLHFGPLSLHVSGRLVEQGSGAPIEGAWVMLALTGSGTRSFWQSHGGCMSDSAVVRTDRDGRFRYTAEISADERAPSQAFTIFAYHPVFTAALRDDALDGASESLKQHVATYGYEGLPGRTYLTLPRGYKEGDGEVLIEMSRRKTTEWDGLQALMLDTASYCLADGIDNGHLEFLESRFERAVDINCPDQSKPALEISLASLLQHLEFVLYLIDRTKHPEHEEHESRQRGASRESYMRFRLLPDIAWTQESVGSLRTATAQDRQTFCDFYRQPIDALLEMEFTQ